MSAATSGASSGWTARSTKPSGSRDELVERARKARQIRELTCRGWSGPLAEAVDPHGAEAEVRRGRDVVEEARADVHVAALRRAGTGEELLPVTVRRLVRADLARHDLELERDTDGPLRRLDEVAVGVREDRELPTALAGLLERRPHLRKRAPAREGGAERAAVLRVEGELGVVRDALERLRQHLVVAEPRLVGLDRGLDLVVAGEQRFGVGVGPQVLELGADAAVPVDQRAVAVHGDPAL